MYLKKKKKRLGGKVFKRQLEFIQKTEKLSREKLLRLQEQELWKIIKHAVKNIPFYRNIKLNPSETAFKNLQKFPIIDKETIQNNLDKFIVGDIPKNKRYYVTTGGTSGRPLGFYLDNSTYGKEWAFIVSLWKRVGYKLGDKIVAFRGVEFKNAKKSGFWQINPIYNALELSPFHMSDKNLSVYLEKIRKWKPAFIHGYPSAITILARYIEKNNIKDFPHVKAVLAGSETIYLGQPEYIEKTLGTRFFSWYGQSEKVILAGECEYSHLYHVFPQYGYTEIIGKDEEPIPWENIDEKGELVGTSFINFVMPFIRYRTEDFATIGGWGCNKCKREYPLISEVRGRWMQEILVGKSRALISMTALNMHSDALKNVYRFQFHQREIGKVVLKLQVTEEFTEKDKKAILEQLFMKVGDELDINIEIVDEIKLSPRGKSLWVVQNLDIKKFWECIG